MKIKANYVNDSVFKEVTVKSNLPANMKCLDEMAHNLWWAWNYEARELWRSIDEEIYEEVNHSPIMLLDRLDYKKIEQLSKDKKFLDNMNAVYTKFKEYMDVTPDETRPSVAYFCMEFGLNQSLKIYSGGLGMLAGDYLKEASDSNVDMVGIGFLYRFGYFTQSLSMDGQQIANYEAQNFNSLPIERVFDADGKPMIVDVPYLNYMVHASVWKANVGRITLYLLVHEEELNPTYHGDMELEDIETGAQVNVSMGQSVLTKYKEVQAKHQQQLEQLCAKYGVALLQVPVEEGFQHVFFHRLKKANWVQ